ncbi:hypothetical protein M3Y99_01768700 [Aphelenchoides fujianensis]|nr:hypothetical protein M3Y99_01768700 [Aphelenchoides fujianensis]
MAIERLDQLPPEVRGKDARFQPITQQLGEVVPKMTSAEIASTLTTLAIRGHRDVPVMRLMAQKLIEEDANLPPSQIVNVSVALKRLSFYFPPLYQFLATKFIYRVNEFSRWSQVASLVDAFAGMQIHNPQFWEVVCKWMDTHIR